MMRKTLSFAILLALVACKKDKKPDEAPKPDPGSGSAGSAVTGSGSAAVGSGSGSAADPTSKVVTGFSTPESALYDAGADVILVSNINGAPADADDNGFISAVLPDGSVKELKWIDGAKPDVKLDAPKGMALSGGTLWVADITVVRKFDAATGKPTGEVKVEGASFLNDVIADGDGGVFVTDSGLDAKFEPTGSDAVLHVGKDGKVAPVIKNKELGHPNGVWLGADGNLWVVTFGTGELYSVPAKGGERGKPEKLAKGQLDGIVQIDGGDLLVSSWEGSVVFRGKPGGPWTELAAGLEAPADIGWDEKRKALLVPQFKGNQLVIKTVQ
jgi:sugar lactone lactonase YvrE